MLLPALKPSIAEFVAFELCRFDHSRVVFGDDWIGKITSPWLWLLLFHLLNGAIHHTLSLACDPAHRRNIP
jgi:hypothetical protein